MIRGIGTDPTTVTAGTAHQFTHGAELLFKALMLYGGHSPRQNHEALDLIQRVPWSPDLRERFSWLAATAERFRPSVAYPGTDAYTAHTQELGRDFWSWAEREAIDLARLGSAVRSFNRKQGPRPRGWLAKRLRQ